MPSCFPTLLGNSIGRQTGWELSPYWWVRMVLCQNGTGPLSINGRPCRKVQKTLLKGSNQQGPNHTIFGIFQFHRHRHRYESESWWNNIHKLSELCAQWRSELCVRPRPPMGIFENGVFCRSICWRQLGIFPHCDIACGNHVVWVWPVDTLQQCLSNLKQQSGRLSYSHIENTLLLGIIRDLRIHSKHLLSVSLICSSSFSL